MFRRRFVNLVVQNRADHVYSLCRIDAAKHLFYPSAQEEAAAADDEKNQKKKYTKTLRRLADPIMSFEPSPTGVLFPGLEWFELFAPGRGEGRIVHSNKAGETGMFDADRPLILTLPGVSECKGTFPLSLSVTHPGAGEDSFYVMHWCPGMDLTEARPGPELCHKHHPHSCFEVLEYSPLVDHVKDNDKRWNWRLLPPPPFVHQPGTPPFVRNELSFIRSYTIIKNAADGCTTICVSDKKNGTYCFDTARLDPTHRLGWKHVDAWRQVGDWELPFEGGAEHVPDLGVWLGFTAGRQPHHLCTVDLSTIMDGPCRQAPTPQHVWEDATLPGEKDWITYLPRVISMGHNRFCVAKLFSDDDEEMRKLFLVLTGVEMELDLNKDLGSGHLNRRRKCEGNELSAVCNHIKTSI